MVDTEYMDDFVNVIKLKPKKSHGKTKNPTTKQNAKYAAKNLTEMSAFSTIFTVFSGLFDMVMTIQ